MRGLWGLGMSFCVIVYISTVVSLYHCMFIAQGNPAVEPRVSTIYCTSAWADRPSLVLSFTTFTSAWFFLPPGTCKHVLAAHAEPRVMRQHPPSAPLVKSHSLELPPVTFPPT